MQNINQIGPEVLEKKSFEWLLPHGHDGHLEFRIMALLATSCITINAKYENLLKLAQ